VVVAFIDLKAAFDSVDREDLEKEFGEEKGEWGIEGKNNGDEETRSVVRVGGRIERKFWTEKGIRQRCPLIVSPMLFNLLIADIEEELRRDEMGKRHERVKLGGRKLKEYADDLVILMEKEEGMRWLMRRLEGYIYGQKRTGD